MADRLPQPFGVGARCLLPYVLERQSARSTRVPREPLDARDDPPDDWPCQVAFGKTTAVEDFDRTPTVWGGGRSSDVHARSTAARPNRAEAPRPQAAPHLRTEGRGDALQRFRGLNFCKFGGGPNGVRTRVSALRGPCPRPLDDGAGRARNWLGEEDSNPRYQGQNLVSYP
jgi:hypothetical protein